MFNLPAPTILLTILVEGIVLWIWSMRSQPQKKRFLHRLLALTVANILTQVLLITALTVSPFRYWPTLLTIELIILLIEAEVLKQTGLSRNQAARLSLLLNLVSFGIGLMLPV